MFMDFQESMLINNSNHGNMDQNNRHKNKDG